MSCYMLHAMPFYSRVPASTYPCFPIISLPSRLNSVSTETLDVPWLVKYLGKPFKDAKSYFQNQCVPPSSSSNKNSGLEGSRPNHLSPSEHEWATLHDVAVRDVDNFQEVSDLKSTYNQSSPRGDAVHILYDNFVKVSGTVTPSTAVL